MPPKKHKHFRHHLFWCFLLTIWFFMFNLMVTFSLLTKVGRHLQITSTQVSASFLQMDSLLDPEVDDKSSSSKYLRQVSIDVAPSTPQRPPTHVLERSNKSQSAIFYNIFINPKNVSWGVRIIEEQTVQMFSLLRTHGRHHRVPLFYTMIGHNYSERFCPEDMSCTFLNYYDNAFEEVTLQKLYEYCVDHPHDRVYYLHNKGSYTALKYNEYDRRDFTNYTFGRGDQLLSNKTLHYNVASKLWQAWPHWLAPANFWEAKCSYVRKLIPPMEYNEARVQMFRRLLQPSSPEEKTSLACLRTFFGNATDIFDLSEEKLHLVGMGRYNFELWIYSHPNVVPCDDPNTIQGTVLESNWAWYPFAYHEWYRMHGRLFEFHQLYRKLPPKSSFFWTTEKLKNRWLRWSVKRVWIEATTTGWQRLKT